MFFAILAAVTAIALGSALGLISEKRRFFGPLQTFAATSAMVVVLFQLLPPAVEALGLWALLMFGLAFAIPVILERITPALMQNDRGIVEFGFWGLLIHKFGDGLGLGTFTGPNHVDHGHVDIVLAIVLHSVPIMALMVVAMKPVLGIRRTLFRMVVLATVTVTGAVVPWSFPVEKWANLEPWVTSAVGGLLLHVVTHAWRSPPPLTAKARTLDFFAALGGLTFLFFGGDGHGAESGTNHDPTQFREILLDLTLDTAPALLFGLVAGAILQTMGSRIPDRWLQERTLAGSAAKGTILGIPLPMCACGILPVVQGLRTRGASVALVVSFLLATPELGIETFFLSVKFLGWPLAWTRLIFAMVVAFVTALVAGGLASTPSEKSETTTRISDPRSLNNPGFYSALEELTYHIAPWTVVGLLVAAFMQMALPQNSVASLGFISSIPLWDVVLLSLIAVPSYVCASSATPLGAVLIAKGFSSGAVIAALLLGPATNVATLGWIKKSLGARAMVYVTVTMLVITWSLAALLNTFNFEIPSTAVMSGPHEHHGTEWVAAITLGSLMLLNIWKEGLGMLVKSLSSSMGLLSAHDHHHHHHHHHH